ncbi:hypothetical protein quinque_004590 [Culex quinquefasciatus]
MANRDRKRELGADLFEVNPETKEAQCNICKTINKSRRNFSYKRHYLNFHRKEAIELGLINEEDAIGPEPKVKKTKVRMDQATYEKSVVDLVSVHGLSLRTLNSPAMRCLMNPYEEALNIPAINSVSVKPMLSDIAGEVKSKIIREVTGKFICLKLDIATRLDRDMLGINIQFMKRKKQVVRTLGIIQLKQRHTAKVIKEEVMRVLQNYGIDLESIYSITTDNGSNMLLTSELIELDLDELLEELHEESCSESGDEDGDEKPQRVDDEDFDRTDELRNIFSAVRCAAHTAQLAVLDTLKETNMRKHISAIKAFVKNLRKMPYKNLLKSDNINKPVLSCDTRWNSAYAMAKSLQDNKQYIANMTKNDKVCHLSESEWDFIEAFVHGFKPMAVLTYALQAEQLTLSDFYILWFRCKLALKKQNDTMSLKLLQNMEKREPSLLNNKAVLAAAYVDQRINYKQSPIFDDDQRAAALEKLRNSPDPLIDTRRLFIYACECLPSASVEYGSPDANMAPGECVLGGAGYDSRSGVGLLKISTFGQKF